jgi:hypothetical protein
MKLRQVTFSLLILAGAFFIGIGIVKLCVANEINSFSPDARWWYSSLGDLKENQVPFIKSYKRGKAEALKDAEQGKLKLKVVGWGQPPEVEEKVFANIYKKYEIELNRIADCGISAKIMGYQQGYNEVMKSAIHQRYGAGFLEKISSEEN